MFSFGDDHDEEKHEAAHHVDEGEHGGGGHHGGGHGGGALHGAGGGPMDAAVAAFAHLADDDPFHAAAMHAQGADAAQARFHDVDAAAPDRGKQKFRALGQTVIGRNRELKALTRGAATADVGTAENGGVLWSGDNLTNGKVDKSAMLTAQAYAAASGRQTVEMTTGGRSLDRYMDPGGDSFGAIRDRFKYLRNPRDHATAPGQAPLMTEMMQNTLAAHGTDGMENHQVRPEQSAAGAMWDVLSKRYATGLSGDVTGVHAYPASQHAALTAGPLANNTYNTVERPAVAATGRAQITDVFGDDPLLAAHLRPPR